jgi:hypothetical protein
MSQTKDLGYKKAVSAILAAFFVFEIATAQTTGLAMTKK